MYLACVIDRCSRCVAGRRLADDTGAAGACARVGSAFEGNGAPSIPDSGQGSVFNSAAYEGLLASGHVRRSMDGKARRVDNVIVGRWFRSLKTECPRISECSTPAELRRLIAAYVEQYNSVRRHQSLGYETPEPWYHSGLAAAA
ncbi:integrase core domain-containing protein [Paratractidigestivibacter sp.]|uniref:integrase core domain-containing protein n=1 Tax=Paratractidigestivibacter sp. TaxID=2847316 RepID=UPI002AC98D12|nr:integrase core domain-containing protein [Paratractidigestivibacter sp.]